MNSELKFDCLKYSQIFGELRTSELSIDWFLHRQIDRQRGAPQYASNKHEIKIICIWKIGPWPFHEMNRLENDESLSRCQHLNYANFKITYNMKHFHFWNLDNAQAWLNANSTTTQKQFVHGNSFDKSGTRQLVWRRN